MKEKKEELKDKYIMDFTDNIQYKIYDQELYQKIYIQHKEGDYFYELEGTGALMKEGKYILEKYITSRFYELNEKELDYFSIYINQKSLVIGELIELSNRENIFQEVLFEVSIEDNKVNIQSDYIKPDDKKLIDSLLVELSHQLLKNFIFLTLKEEDYNYVCANNIEENVRNLDEDICEILSLTFDSVGGLQINELKDLKHNIMLLENCKNQNNKNNLKISL